MTLPAEWTGCLQLAALLGLQGILVVAASSAFERWAASPQWQRTGWRAAALTWLLLLFLDLSGLCYQLRPRQMRATASTPPVTISPLAGAPSPGSSEPMVVTPVASAAVQPTTAESSPAPRPLPRVRKSLPISAAPDPLLAGRSFPWPALIWILGAVATLAPSVLARLALGRRYGRRRVSFDGALLLRVSQTAARVSLHRRVRVFECDRLAGPIAFGVLRPSIGLPAGFTRDFLPRQQEAMLAHELAHLAARDPLWQMVGDVTAALLWWHPLAWWTRLRLNAVSEDAADRASLAVDGGPGLLAESLLQLASRMVGRSSPGRLAATGSGFRSGLGRRIEKLVHLTPESARPLSRARAGGVLVAAPITLAAVTILCTGWIAPEPQGEPMQRLQQIWIRSLATAALFTAVAAEPTAAAPAPPNSGATTNTLAPAAAPPGMDPRLAERYGLLPSTNAPPAAAEPTAEPAAQPAAEAPNRYRMDPQLMRRYGLIPKAPPGAKEMANAARRGSRGKQEIEAKLNQILLGDVSFDGLPLSEVVKFLQDVARTQDPAKVGLNFLVSNVPEAPVGGAIDPTTGQVTPAPNPDISNAMIRLHLRDVRLRDVLDAMTRVSDQPIKYSIEEYGVLLSPGSGQAAPVFGTMGRPSEPIRLQVQTFRLDTNSFLPGLESAFGIAVRQPEGSAATNDPAAPAVADRSAASPREIQAALRQLLQQVGVNLDVPNKAVFYNGLTGVLMVRATPEDLELVQAAVETLGGNVLRKTQSSNTTVPNPAGEQRPRF